MEYRNDAEFDYYDSYLWRKMLAWNASLDTSEKKIWDFDIRQN